jgi:glycosyltransferase involved in cell wall biosynthesis
MKKVVMLLSNPFRPDPRVYKEAKTLIEGGYDVTIVAWDREGGYPREEIIENIKVHRISIKSTYGDFFSFITKLPLFWLKTFFLLLKTSFNIIHCHDFDTFPLGLFVGKLKGKKVVYDVHELYSGMISISAPKTISKIVCVVESVLMRYAIRIITVNEALAKTLEKYGLHDIEVVMNCEEIMEIPKNEVKELRDKINPENKVIILYIGALEPGRFIEESIEIVQNLDNILLIIAGYGSMYNKIEKEARRTKNVEFIGTVHPNEVPVYAKAADMMIGMFDPSNENYRLSTPTKLLDAMVAGTPIILNKEIQASKIVMDEKCGLTIPYDPTKFRNTIVKLRDNPKLREELGRNGLRAAKEKYNWKEMGKRLLRIYGSLVGT